ncbi:MAG TPA: DUF58 domain-containing protein [Gemmataceae bacterium]|nr:DUF58 domain-containing protein [Gemmataceae bacterium]
MSETNRRHLPLSGRLVFWLRRVSTYDVFPEFSATVRRLLYNPMGVLILAALAALLCGAFLHAQGFVLFGSVSAVLALGSMWPWLTLRGLRGSIDFEKARAVEGERVEAYLTLRNRLPWTAYGLAVRDGLSNRGLCAEEDGAQLGETCEGGIHIAWAPHRCTIRCRWIFVPARRGVYPLSTPLVTTGFPFGLWENKRALSIATPLVVWPRTYPVGPVPMVSGDQQVEGNVSRNKVGSNGDVLGVRPYRRGDSPRRIHWGQSARHDRLIVCELQSNARPIVHLILDTDPSVHVGRGNDSSYEWAIRIVASLAIGWLTAGVEVRAAWNEQVIPASSGPKQPSVLLDALAKLPDAEGMPLRETMSRAACRGLTDGLQIIVTTDVGMDRATDGPVEEYQRWVVLQTEGFLCTGQTAPAPPLRACGNRIRPWLLIDSPDRVPPLLRGGWKEAQHGS